MGALGQFWGGAALLAYSGFTEMAIGNLSVTPIGNFG